MICALRRASARSVVRNSPRGSTPCVRAARTPLRNGRKRMHHLKASGLCVFAVALVTLSGLEGAELRAAEAATPEPPQSLKQGDTFPIQGHRTVLTKLDALPYVETEYSKRFKFDSHDNPRLKQLRGRYRLDE